MNNNNNDNNNSYPCLSRKVYSHHHETRVTRVTPGARGQDGLISNTRQPMNTVECVTSDLGHYNKQLNPSNPT